MPYTIHSGFNPKLHKQTFIHYLEVIIDENGKNHVRRSVTSREDDKTFLRKAERHKRTVE